MNQQIWQKCIDFHGHQCGGLLIGYHASMTAIQLLDISYSNDEEIVCVTENDACGVDAIQVILGCSAGKGNLLFHLRGKQAFSFYRRDNGKSVRLVFKPLPSNLSKEEMFQYLLKAESKALFHVKETTIQLPKRAEIFPSQICQVCGEKTAENWVRLYKGKPICMDCFTPYNRLDI